MRKNIQDFLAEGDVRGVIIGENKNLDRCTVGPSAQAHAKNGADGCYRQGLLMDVPINHYLDAGFCGQSRRGVQDEDEQPREKISCGAAFFDLLFAHVDLLHPIVSASFSYY